MKKVYQKPDLEVIAFESEDVITTSVIITPDPDVPDTGDSFE